MEKTFSIQHSNKNFYDKIWKYGYFPEPTSWPHWKIIRKYTKGRCLEIGPGTKPKIPIKGNYFLDISREAVTRLNSLGGIALQADLSKQLPFQSSMFDLICAFEVLEHVPNDQFVLEEFARLLKTNGVCLISFPINMKYWNAYDRTVGHVRRYDPERIEQLFNKHHLTIVQACALDIPWPNCYTGILISYLAKNLPRLVSKATVFLDSLPWASIRKPIDLHPWTKDSFKHFASHSTAFFLLMKMETYC